MEEKMSLEAIEAMVKEENYQSGIRTWTNQGFAGSLEHFEKSAGQGNLFAYVWLAYLYENIKPEAEETAIYKSKVNEGIIAWLMQRVEQGSRDAQLCLGICYMIGLVVDKDENQGKGYYKKAADQGDVIAQFMLAESYNIRGTLERDEEAYREAVKWYKLAVDNTQMSRAQTRLAMCYEHGTGVAKNTDLAVDYYCQAANQGEPYAQGWLGDYYSNPQNPNRNLSMGLQFFKKAETQGHEWGEVKMEEFKKLVKNTPF